MSVAAQVDQVDTYWRILQEVGSKGRTTRGRSRIFGGHKAHSRRDQQVARREERAGASIDYAKAVGSKQKLRGGRLALRLKAAAYDLLEDFFGDDSVEERADEQIESDDAVRAWQTEMVVRDVASYRVERFLEDDADVEERQRAILDGIEAEWHLAAQDLPVLRLDLTSQIQSLRAKLAKTTGRHHRDALEIRILELEFELESLSILEQYAAA